MNKKRYWLRGGKIAVIVCAILYLCLFVVGFSAHDLSDAYGSSVENIFSFIANIILIAPLSAEGFSTMESILISGVCSFLVGAFLGLLYGKVKNKNKIIQ